MLRWHASYCTDPVISIKGPEVSCQNCSAAYSFNQHSVPQDTAAGLYVPPDRPLGQLKLRWPPSVPYTTDEELDVSHSATAITRDTDKSPVPSERTSEDAAQTTIYHQLEVGQFRLMCLYSAESHGDLIHLDLEQYNLDDCPEYEATSYAWGGEDGDSKPSGPIFIGKFYDVAFQTKNCLSMLRYLRPTRGVRMVWIDAICIDQSNVHEREAQVAEMRNIYRSASRVVVYLGPDTVSQPTQQHRRRSWLGGSRTFEYNDDLTFQKLLDHRYFSRVWVIQELLLARSLMIPLQDSDYHADSTCIKRLDVDWKSTKAPWFEHIASGRVFSRNELHSWLYQTWSSESTDPRDKLFAILGLVNTAVCDPEPHATANSHRNTTYSLLPDYTLSTQETLIGLVGYVMITLDQRHILEHAAGQKAAPGYPTWLPDMRERFIWSSPEIARQEDCTQLEYWYRNICLCCKKVWVIASCLQDIYYMSRNHIPYEGPYRVSDSSRCSALRLMMSRGNSTNESLSINSSTAALLIKLVRIIQLSSRPRRIADFGSLRVFEFVMAQHSLLLCTGLIDLDLFLDNTPTWMFLKDSENFSDSVVFFLRESPQSGLDTAYELVRCCRCWDLVIFRRPQLPVNSDAAGADPPKGNGAHVQLMRSPRNDLLHMKHSDHCPPYNGHGVWWECWTQPVPYETLYAAAGMIDPDSALDPDLLRAFPEANLRVKDTLPLFQLLTDVLSLEEISYHQFGELYISLMGQFSSVQISMEPPCDIDHPRLGRQFRGVDIRHRHGSMFFTFEPAIWESYVNLLRPWMRFDSDPFLSEVFVNQKITKVMAASDTLSTMTQFMGSTIPESSNQGLFLGQMDARVFRSKYKDDPFWGRTEEQESDRSHVWMGWCNLQEIVNTVSKDFIDENATVYMCLSLTRIVEVMKESVLGKCFRNLTKFRSATGQDETTMALNVDERYRNIFAHSWPDSLREEIGLIGEPCRVQIL